MNRKIKAVLAIGIPIGSDPDILHAIAEQRPDLFLVTANDRFIKLYPEAVERIVGAGVERTIAEASIVRSEPVSARDHRRCDHFSSEEEIVADLMQCSFHPDILTRDCCWREICRVRSSNPGLIDSDTWREVCRVRGYLRMRQNPRGF